MSASLRFQGCYTAIVTPFTADGSRVDRERLEENVRLQAAGGVAGIVPCGTTGESPTLSEEEHALVVEAAVRVGRPLGLQVVAGAGSNSTVHAVHLQKLALQLGADAGLQVTPYYNKPSQEGIYRHFMAVADSCDLPVMLYNIPGRAGVAIAPETVERLSRHPNVRAIKEATASMDSASEIRRLCGIAVLSGDDSLTPSFAAVGAAGVVSVVSNLVPARVARLCGLVHDIGKIGVSEDVLRKPGRLTDEEFRHVAAHPVTGHEILRGIPQMSVVLPGVLHHHERHDGRGYPHGLAGEAIPLLARVVAVADAIDAMTTSRTYRPARPMRDAVAEVLRSAGTHFDPVLARVVGAIDLRDLQAIVGLHVFGPGSVSFADGHPSMRRTA